MSEIKISVGQFVVTRGWGEFTAFVAKADVLTPKLVKTREGWRGGRERFSQVPRENVLASFATLAEARALEAEIQKIKRTFNGMVSEARGAAEKAMEAIYAKARGESV